MQPVRGIPLSIGQHGMYSQNCNLCRFSKSLLKHDSMETTMMYKIFYIIGYLFVSLTKEIMHLLISFHPFKAITVK